MADETNVWSGEDALTVRKLIDSGQWDNLTDEERETAARLADAFLEREKISDVMRGIDAETPLEGLPAGLHFTEQMIERHARVAPIREFLEIVRDTEERDLNRQLPADLVAAYREAFRRFGDDGSMFGFSPFVLHEFRKGEVVPVHVRCHVWMPHHADERDSDLPTLDVDLGMYGALESMRSYRRRTGLTCPTFTLGELVTFVQASGEGR